MRYRYNSRSAKRLAKKSKRNFIVTIIIILALIYATIQWILPSVIGGVGLISSKIKPVKKIVATNYESLAPPVLDIPFDATNTAKINITGYAPSNSKVELLIDEEVEDTTETKEDGSFEFRSIALSLGTNNISGKTIDDKGTESLPSKTLSVYYSNEKPNLSISEPENNKEIQGGDKKVAIKGKTDLNINIYINDTRIITSSDGSFSSDQPLNDGDNNFNIKAIDKAGNEAELSRKVIYKP